MPFFCFLTLSKSKVLVTFFIKMRKGIFQFGFRPFMFCLLKLNGIERNPFLWKYVFCQYFALKNCSFFSSSFLQNQLFYFQLWESSKEEEKSKHRKKLSLESEKKKTMKDSKWHCLAAISMQSLTFKKCLQLYTVN
jgi:hypothetical protein